MDTKIKLKKKSAQLINTVEIFERCTMACTCVDSCGPNCVFLIGKIDDDTGKAHTVKNDRVKW